MQFLKSRNISLTHTAFALSCVWLYFLFSKAWMTEDAFITFRVIDNFVNGYGLRWNINERVQIYTHPLWMLLNIPLHYIFGNGFLVGIFSSMFCSFLAAFILLRLCPHFWLQLIITVLLCFSRGMTEYGTSGLENGLFYLLLALIVHVVVNREQLRYAAFWFSLLYGCALMNRLDAVFLFLPLFALGILFRTVPFKPVQICMGLVPLGMWLVFATFYYGSPFPNTFFAKLSGNLGNSNYWQGVAYLKRTVRIDAVVLASFVIWGIMLLEQVMLLIRRRTICIEVVALLIGCVLNVAYVVHIGGDYMVGRFFTSISFAVLCAMVLRARSPIPLCEREICLGMLVCAGCYATLYFNPEKHCWLNRYECEGIEYRIVDTWRFESPVLGLSYDGILQLEPKHHWTGHGYKLRYNPPGGPIFAGNCGQMPYYAGPEVHFIDSFGLGDALMARMPVVRQFPLVGHSFHWAPHGYLESIGGDFSKLDLGLLPLVNLMANITRGDLWSWERLHDIYLLNTGEFQRQMEYYHSLKNQHDTP